MRFYGEYTLYLPDSVAKRSGIPVKLTLPNTVVKEGREQMLRGITRNEAMGLTGGPPTLFYVGLCNQASDEVDLLSDIITEPTSAGGYARQSITRDSVGWPTIDEVAGQKRALSKVLTFSAVGADFSTAFTRAFMCSVSTGTAGYLFSYSGALTTPITLLTGESFQMQYSLYGL